MRASTAGVGRAAAVMGLGTLLSRLTGVARSIALTALGIGIVTDTYQVANNTPNIVYELLLGGVLSSALVPVFVELFDTTDLRRHGEGDGWRGASALITLAGVLMIASSVILAIAAPHIIHLFTLRGPDPVKRAVATELLRFFAPQVALYGLVTIATALLNVGGRFAAPMFAPILNNVVVVCVLWWTSARLHHIAAASNPASRLAAIQSSHSLKLVLGVGTTVGVLVMAVALLPSLRATAPKLRPVWDPTHPAVRRTLTMAGWTFGYVVANMAAFVFVVVAAGRSEADLTAYTQAYSTFYLLPHGLLAVSLMNALQPSLARSFVERKRGRFRRQLHYGLRNLLAIMIPAAAGYIVLARPIVAVLLRDQKAQLVADTLRAFAFGLPSFSAYLLLMNAAKAMRRTRLTFTVNVVENCINIVAAAVLYPRYGVQGLAAAFALAYVISAFLAGAAVATEVNGIGERDLLMATGRMIIAAAVMAGAVRFTSTTIEGLTSNPTSRLAQLLEIGGSVLVGVTVYGVAGRLLGISEIASVVSILRRRSRRPT